jgi:hypothetical protein
MLSRMTVALLFVCTALLADTPTATPTATPTKHVAPDTVPHPTALFLASLSGDGRHEVTFKAAAMGTHFFFEEPIGVTVYEYDGRGYRKQAFLKGFKLGKAIKKYAK